MGCDIHDVIQKKVDGKWKTVAKDIYDGRNYELFAMLADVRNGFDIEPIHEPRGYPEDFEVEGDDEHEGHWMGDHSHSWATLHEMKAYLWKMEKKLITQTCIVTEADLPESGRPKRYSRGVYGGSVLVLTEHTYREMKEKGIPFPSHKNIYIEYKFQESYTESESFKSIVEKMQAIGEDTRYVFGFDN